MAPTPHATTTASTAPPAPLAPPAPPPRQSCDRCHKQKLRCTRENNSDGGVCDRCFRKRVQCVYSFSLPKGRPSVYRLPDEPTTSSISGPKSSGLEHEPVNNTDSDADADADASTKMNVDAIQVTNPSTDEQSVLAGLMDTSMDVSTGTWPWLDTSSWDDTQLDIDWSSHDLSYADAVLASPNAFGNNGSALDPPSPNHPPYPPSPRHLHAYPHGQPGGGGFEKHDGSNRSNMGKSIGGGGDGTTNMSLDKYMNWPSLVIAQLSQLSTRLSSLRYSSHTLANAAESSSSRLPSGRQIPLIDAAAFETVAAWLAHGHDSANMNVHPPVHALAQSQGPYPSPDTKSRGGHGILHDVFSASHRLLEILRHLQVKNIAEPSSTAPSAFTSSAAPSGQSSVHLRLTKGPWSSVPSSGSQQHSHNTMQIIRHLVMACEALLLEIYMAVLTALQHDAFHGASLTTTALGDVRLVLVVQLCSYLIERQQQAVDLCLAPQRPLSPLSVSGMFPPRLDQSGPEKPVPPGPVMNAADREVLSDLKNQVQQRLAHLRQTLRCT